jgi:hypothetical protein
MQKEAGTEVHHKVGSTVVIDAGVDITLAPVQEAPKAETLKPMFRENIMIGATDAICLSRFSCQASI